MTPLLTTSEVLALLRVSRRYLERKRNARELPFVKIGRRVLYRPADVEAFVASRSFGHPVNLSGPVHGTR